MGSGCVTVPTGPSDSAQMSLLGASGLCLTPFESWGSRQLVAAEVRPPAKALEGPPGHCVPHCPRSDPDIRGNASCHAQLVRVPKCCKMIHFNYDTEPAANKLNVAGLGC